MVDAHTCRYRERVYAHLIMRGGGRVVSLFVQNTPLGQLPPAAGQRSLLDLSGPIYIERQNGYEAEGHQAGAYQVVLVSDLPFTDADPLSASVIPPAVKFLHRP